MIRRSWLGGCGCPRRTRGGIPKTRCVSARIGSRAPLIEDNRTIVAGSPRAYKHLRAHRKRKSGRGLAADLDDPVAAVEVACGPGRAGEAGGVEQAGDRRGLGRRRSRGAPARPARGSRRGRRRSRHRPRARSGRGSARGAAPSRARPGRAPRSRRRRCRAGSRRRGRSGPSTRASSRRGGTAARRPTPRMRAFPVATARARASMSVPTPGRRGPFGQQGQEDRPAAGAEVEDRRRHRPVEGGGDQRLGLGPRVEHGAGDGEVAPPEGRRPTICATGRKRARSVTIRRRRRPLAGASGSASTSASRPGATPSAAAISRRASRGGVGDAGGRRGGGGGGEGRAHRRSCVEVGQPRRLVGGGERLDHLVEVALHHLVELVEGQADAVVGQAALREVVGADALRAVAACRPGPCGRRRGRRRAAGARGRRGGRAAPASPGRGSGAATSPS